MADTVPQDQKSEEATPRKLEKAFAEGQIAFSSELVSSLSLLAGVIFFFAAGAWFFNVLKNLIRERSLFTSPFVEYPDTVLLAMRRDVLQAVMIIVALAVPISLVALSASFMQTRFNLTAKPLAWNWERLSPRKGLQRVFSSRAVIRGLISIAKAVAIAATVYCVTAARWSELALTGHYTLDATIQIGAQLLIWIGLLTAALMTAVGAADYAFQWWKQRQELRMTLQEVRDEMKESDGDPLIKARLRRIANELGKKRMMQAVRDATVVVTNPTHYAVALRYDPEQAPAPVVVAKGVDFLAQNIIRLAQENRVPVVERKEVARYLYAKVRLGQEIPYTLFQAVAEILNFIRRIEQRAA